MKEKKIPPCEFNCPARVNIRDSINLIKQQRFADAINLIKTKLPFPASISRICPHPCELNCTRKFKDGAINIHQIRIFLTDIFLNQKRDLAISKKNKAPKKICIVGAGAGGISCAYFLGLCGHDIFIFDQMPEPGGMLKYGVPEYRLPKKILDHEINFFHALNINFFGNIKINKQRFNILKKKFDAVILAIGAWAGKEMSCEGKENFYDGIKFLRDIKLGKKNIVKNKKIAVIGGGNTAIDICRSALRLNAKKVINIYRRTKNEMPAEASEINDAMEEGVIFKELLSPEKIINDDRNKKILFMQKYELGEKDIDGRASIIKTNEIIKEEFDFVILAIGQDIESDFFDGEKNPDGTIKVNNVFETSEKKVFCIGDAIRIKNRIAINAIADAKKVCDYINNVLLGEENCCYKKNFVENKPIDLKINSKLMSTRLEMKKKCVIERKNNFDEVILPWSREDFLKEASRCLNCRGCKLNDGE